MSSALSLLFLVPALAVADKPSPLGKKVDNFQLRDYRGADKSLSDFADRKLVVLAFFGTECPIAKLYGPRLAQLAREFEPRGVAFLGINSNQQDSFSAISQYARQHGLTFPILKDVGNVLADRLGAVRIPEVFVLDGQRVVRYWGRIDDQYGIGFTRPKIGRRDLAVALDELLAGKPISIPLTEAPGCFIGRVQKETSAGPLTYCKDIARILQKRCLECHRAGEIAPFALTTYEEVIGWTDTIQEVIQEGRMPPWHADPRYGKFANDSRLPAAEKKQLLDWIAGGAPRGDTKDLPPPVTFAQGWRIPTPDLVLTIPRPIQIPAEGTVPYEYVAVDPGFEEDKWVRAAEIQPSCRPVVHHVLVFVQPPGGRPGERGGFASNWLAATVPGAKPLLLAEGLAKRIPAGSRLLFQIHYTPNGAPQTDQTRLGLVFADPQTVKQEVSTEMVANPRLRIPANTDNVKIEASVTLREETPIVELLPHTHLRGKAFRYEAFYPDGKQEILLDVPQYDFNWQNTYVFAEPKLLPSGTRIHCVAYYNNSRSNPSNPDPNREVRWGEQTWEEMMIGYYDRLVPRPAKGTSVGRLVLSPVDAELKRLAAHALESQAAFEAFAAGVRKAVPQVDRVCVTTYSHDTLRVERAAYPGAVSPHFAEAGFTAPGRACMLSGIALLNQVQVFADLKKAQGMDLRRMSESLGSSVHVAAAVDGKPATVNFWSKDKAAFSKDTQALLRALAAGLTRPR
jgi:peroxiredoxin